MERAERHRHPVGRQDLDVGELRHPVRGEPEREPGDQRRVVPPRDHVVRGKYADSAHREKERDVVGQQHIAGGPDRSAS